MESLGGPRKGSIDVGAISVALIARIIYILKFCIPDLHLQAEKAESMVRLRLTLLRSPDEMDQIKTELEGYFDAIGKKINGAIILYVLIESVHLFSCPELSKLSAPVPSNARTVGSPQICSVAWFNSNRIIAWMVETDFY